jgi:hypothetical protein
MTILNITPRKGPLWPWLLLGLAGWTIAQLLGLLWPPARPNPLGMTLGLVLVTINTFAMRRACSRRPGEQRPAGRN